MKSLEKFRLIIEGKRRINRKRLSWLENIKQRINMNTESLLRVAEDRDTFKDVRCQLGEATAR